MSTEKEKWFAQLPKWLRWCVRILVALLAAICCITGYGLISCGNSKVLLRNASNASISQKGSNIEVVVSTPINVDSVKVR